MTATKILIVEDELLTAMSLADDLEAMGYEIVDTVTSGEEAIQIANDCQPDLILMDINLAGSIDGIDTALEIRQHLNIPVIFLTSYNSNETVKRAQQTGSFGYLLKPFKVKEVSTSIEIALSKYQEELSLRQALASAKQYSEQQLQSLAIAAHEFRTPLSVIQLSTDMLKDGGDKLAPDKKSKHFERIQRSIDSISQMIKDVLTVGKVESGELVCNPSPLDLDRFCAELVSVCQIHASKLHQVTYQIQYPDEAAKITPNLDPDLLLAILSNLLTNAIKYSPQGGEVNLSVTCKSNNVTFEVQDCGIGIPTEYYPKIFERFVRAENANKIKGTGLGLSIVKNLVDLHKGEIKFDSRVSEGTKFTVTLPYLL
ncbi:ATP-binding protein [Pseudanabaena sp. PCC 6802]|uniref:hybrid sensor histidine kinase/response regulator n=1 Tax=Pseudanabaena sp. PCC 6802 TaxID=118173 RepID=UPI00034DC78C|nr:ATP-binding protein [Pseudanabaena sp. PCC 6802]